MMVTFPVDGNSLKNRYDIKYGGCRFSMQLKDDSKEIEYISEEKKEEDYRVLKSRVEFVLAGYRDQLVALNFKRRKLKVELVNSVAVSVLAVVAFPVVLALIPSPSVRNVIGGVFGGMVVLLLSPFIADTVKKAVLYAVMNEKIKPVKAIAGTRLATFPDEEMFILKKIAEYEMVLEKRGPGMPLTEEHMLELEKLSIPEEYHSSPLNKDFKLWPFYLLTAVWVVFALVMIL